MISAVGSIESERWLRTACAQMRAAAKRFDRHGQVLWAGCEQQGVALDVGFHVLEIGIRNSVDVVHHLRLHCRRHVVPRLEADDENDPLLHRAAIPGRIEVDHGLPVPTLGERILDLLREVEQAEGAGCRLFQP